MNLVLTKIESNNEEGFEPHPHPPQKAKTTPTHPRSSHKLYNCVRAPKGVIFEPISAEMGHFVLNLGITQRLQTKIRASGENLSGKNLCFTRRNEHYHQSD